MKASYVYAGRLAHAANVTHVVTHECVPRLTDILSLPVQLGAGNAGRHKCLAMHRVGLTPLMLIPPGYVLVLASNLLHKLH